MVSAPEIKVCRGDIAIDQADIREISHRCTVKTESLSGELLDLGLRFLMV